MTLPPSNFCEECGRGYWVKPYRRAKSRFCSFECGGRFRARETLNVGPKPWAAKNLDGHRHKSPSRFTSERVRGSNNPNWKEPKYRECEKCGASFGLKPWVIRQNASRFCSRKCFEASECFVGESSSSWVGGQATYRGRNWKAVRAEVVSDQGGDCFDCGRHIGNSLSVHHKRPFREFDDAETANERSNLVGLCQSCHMKWERNPKPVQTNLLDEEVA